LQIIKIKKISSQDMIIKEEIWKDIPEYEGYYQVSNYGNFKSLNRIVKYKQNKTRIYPGKLLLVEPTKDNYRRIVLMKNGIKTRYMCHRLVASAFIPNIENKPCINHKDGNKSNNRVDNLEWCTPSENMKHAVQTGLLKGHYINSNNIKLKCVETGIEYASIKDASRQLNINDNYLWKCVHKQKICKGLHFIII
jgi:hypothetical protein